jgi:hypothetical protein
MANFCEEFGGILAWPSKKHNMTTRPLALSNMPKLGTPKNFFWFCLSLHSRCFVATTLPLS